MIFLLEFIQNVFQSIAEFFSKIWEILVFIFDELTQFFKMISPAIKFFQTLFTTLPPIFVVFGIAMLAVMIIYVILGRTAGGD